MLVKATVSNHMGKKYVTAKLQFETRKLLIPTKTGTLSLSKNGASIGSGVYFSSAMRKKAKNIIANDNEKITDGDNHCFILIKLEDDTSSYCTHRLLFIVFVAHKNQKEKYL